MKQLSLFEFNHLDQPLSKTAVHTIGKSCLNISKSEGNDYPPLAYDKIHNMENLSVSSDVVIYVCGVRRFQIWYAVKPSDEKLYCLIIDTFKHHFYTILSLADYLKTKYKLTDIDETQLIDDLYSSLLSLKVYKYN